MLRAAYVCYYIYSLFSSSLQTELSCSIQQTWYMPKPRKICAAQIIRNALPSTGRWSFFQWGYSLRKLTFSLPEAKIWGYFLFYQYDFMHSSASHAGMCSGLGMYRSYPYRHSIWEFHVRMKATVLLSLPELSLFMFRFVHLSNHRTSLKSN